MSYSFTKDLRRQLGICTSQTQMFVRSVPARWSHWWFRDCPPHALAAFRIVFGMWLLVVWLDRFFFGFRFLFTDLGAQVPLLNHNAPNLIALLGTAPPLSLALIIAAVLMIAILSLTIGFHSRVASGVLLLLSLYYFNLSVHLFQSTMDALSFFILLVFTFSDTDATFSLSMRLKHGSFLAWHPISILPQRLLAVQLTALYAGVSFQKLVLPMWIDGRELQHTFQGIWATPFALWFTRHRWSDGNYNLFVFLVKWGELILPVGLWLPKIRIVFFGLGLLFHVLVALFLGLWWFLLLPGMYLLLLPPEAVQRFCSTRFGVPVHPSR